MKQTDTILRLAQKNHGIITAADVKSAGLSRGVLIYLLNQGKLEKSARGVYILPSAWDDEFVNLQSRYKRGIFSLSTALFLNDLTDRTPTVFEMTFPQGYNLSGPKREGGAAHTVKEAVYSLGMIEMKTPIGNMVRSYNAERTLCDILMPKNHMDIQLVTESFKIYMTRKNRNIPLLSEYAKKLKVEKKMRSYLEVLL